MTPPREPTADECSNHSPLGDGWFAIWYPQIGGYVGKAAIIRSGNMCFDAYVWHDGEFPFDGEDMYGDKREPRRLHHCDPDQFVYFGQMVEKLLKEE